MLELGGVDGTLVAYANTPSLPPIGVSVLPGDQVPTAVFAGAGAGTGGIVQLRGENVVDVTGQMTRVGHAIAGVNDGKVVIVGGGDGTTLTSDAIEIDPGTAPSVTAKPALLATPRGDPAVVASHEFLIVAGGTAMDGSLVADAEVFDTVNLNHVVTIPLVVPRTRATAIALPNRQIMIVGGVDATGAPLDTIELFTPRPPAE